PRQFVVETRTAVATDLGCAYTLEVGRDGCGRLSVTSGRVAFADSGRESFVPAGVSCPLSPAGVGVPRRDYAGDAVLAALAALHGELAGRGGTLGAALDSTGTAAAALDRVLARAEALDAISLWHLLPRTTGSAGVRVARRIAELIAVPAEPPIERVLALDP